MVSSLAIIGFTFKLKTSLWRCSISFKVLHYITLLDLPTRFYIKKMVQLAPSRTSNSLDISVLTLKGVFVCTSNILAIINTTIMYTLLSFRRHDRYSSLVQDTKPILGNTPFMHHIRDGQALGHVQSFANKTL